MRNQGESQQQTREELVYLMRKAKEFRELEGEEQKACAKSFFHTAKIIIDKANQSLKTIDSATGAVERLMKVWNTCESLIT